MAKKVLSDEDNYMISLYKDIRDVMNKLLKQDCFNTFTPGDLFMNAFSDTDDIYLMRFNNKFMYHHNSFELFTSEKGFNYLYDGLSLAPEFMRFYELDGIVLMLLDSDSIDERDGKFIHKMGCKIKHENNVLIYHYHYGKKRTLPTINDLKLLYRNLEFIESLIKNEPHLITAFNENRIALSQIDTEKLEYNLIYREMPYLEYFPKKSKANTALIEEYKNSIYSPDDAYLLTTYYPMVIKETGVRPLIITYIEGKKMIIKYISSAPNTYKDLIFGIMDSIWSELGMLPEKLHIDSREFYKALENTLDGLNIEYDFFRDVPSMAAIEAPDRPTLDLLKKIKPGDRDLESDIQPREVVEKFLDALTSSIENLSEIALDDISEYEFDEEDESEEENDNSALDTDTDYVA